MRGGLVDPEVEEHLEDMSAIAPIMLLLKYTHDKDFMEFVWIFTVPVSWIKGEIMERVKTCGNNLL